MAPQTGFSSRWLLNCTPCLVSCLIYSKVTALERPARLLLKCQSSAGWPLPQALFPFSDPHLVLPIENSPGGLLVHVWVFLSQSQQDPRRYCQLLAEQRNTTSQD